MGVNSLPKTGQHSVTLPVGPHEETRRRSTERVEYAEDRQNGAGLGRRDAHLPHRLLVRVHGRRVQP